MTSMFYKLTIVILGLTIVPVSSLEIDDTENKFLSNPQGSLLDTESPYYDPHFNPEDANLFFPNTPSIGVPLEKVHDSPAAENSEMSRVPARNADNQLKTKAPFRSPFTTNEDSVIIQFLPELSVDRFLTVYPSLKYKMQGNVSIGAFKAVFGNFDRRFVRLLAYSNLVRIKKNKGGLHFGLF